MKLTSMLSAGMLFGAVVLGAAETWDIKEFTPLKQDAGAVRISESFNGKTVAGLWMPEGFTLDATGGESGTGALFCEKKTPGKQLLAALDLKLSPQYKYRAKIRYRAENLKNVKGARLFCVEFYNQKKYAGGEYYYKEVTDGQWSEIVLEFQPPAKFDHAFAGFLMPKNATGKVWWDNFSIEPAGMISALIYDVRPSNLTIRDHAGRISLKAYMFLAGIPEKDLRMYVSAAGKEYFREGKNGVYSVELGDLPDGELKAAAKLLNIKNRVILAEKELRLFVRKGQPADRGSYIDEYGRTVVDGKPFLPLGFYCMYPTDEILRNLKEGGFNFVMPYRGHLDIGKNFALARKYGIRMFLNMMYQRPRGQGMAQAIPQMEFEDARGVDEVLRAWVRKVKNEPMLMGYYLSDENPVDEVPYMRRVRENINEIDPDHLTVTLTYIAPHFPFFAETGDVLAVDNYPVETVASRTMKEIPNLLDDACRTGIGVWFVPQTFNWGVYKAKTPEEYRKYRFPTETEMRSMFLAGAVSGAKGFLCYAYHDIFELGDRKEPGSSAKNWPTVVRAVKILKELEPFILSVEKTPEVTVHSAANARLCVWTAGGRTAVAIVGLGPGQSSVEFTISGQPGLKSRFGGTVNLGGGKYRFTGNDICSDVLFSD